MGSTARPRYIGLREISERDISELYCIHKIKCMLVKLVILPSSKSVNNDNKIFINIEEEHHFCLCY